MEGVSRVVVGNCGLFGLCRLLKGFELSMFT